jgi:carbon monoxide dehydrogenase subunit G
VATVSGWSPVNFENTFTVPVCAADVWDAMKDLERVAPCMPGAEVTERTGEDAYRVQVRVKLGPMSMTYRGQAEITDRDEEARTAAMRVQARETRGQGSANATVQIKVDEEGVSTRATMTTELKLSGRAAAMGGGVITNVSHALVSEFADNLARMLSETPGDGASGAVATCEVGASAPVAVPASGASVPPSETLTSAPPPPQAAPPFAQSAPPPQPKEALDAAHLARNVVTSRLREPRTQLSARVGLALACLAVGFGLGRRAGRR